MVYEILWFMKFYGYMKYFELCSGLFARSKLTNCGRGLSEYNEADFRYQFRFIYSCQELSHY